MRNIEKTKTTEIFDWKIFTGLLVTFFDDF